MTIEPGQDLLHYRILEKIGEGGMGVVWKALDTRLDRPVAIKVLPERFATDPERLARFEREARAVAALRHPSIVTIHALERTEETRFIAMEFVEGRSLSEVLRDGRPPAGMLCDLLLPLVDALAAAHAAGVVHRDLKPGNVMVGPDGGVMLLDFGVAKFLGSGDPCPDLATALATRPGTPVGTPAYMAPEQIRGAPADERSDLFSLGILMYELGTGRHPFVAGSSMEVISGILRDTPPPCGELDGSGIERLAGIVERCLEKDPERRFQSAAELKAELLALKESTYYGNVAPATDPGPGGSLERGRRAFEAQDWAAAHDNLMEAFARGPLAPEDLELLGEARFWVGRQPEANGFYEQAYAAYLDAGRTEPAGRVAVILAECYSILGSKAVAAGWIKRAERLLINPDTVEYGYLLRHRTKLAIETRTDLEQALEWSQRIYDIGRRFHDPNLEALGLVDRGQAQIQLGEVTEGMALMDEAMALASSGALNPMTTGRVYCNMMGACEMVADYQRAGEWSVAASIWCEPHLNSAYPGLCRVHRAGALRLAGDWVEAERLARLVQEQFRDFHGDIAGEACYEIGEIRLRLGDFEGAETSFSQAHERGRDPLPGLANLRRAQGNLPAAVSLLARALDETRLPLERARLLPAWIELSVEAGDIAAARKAAEELEAIGDRFGSQTYVAAAGHGWGLCLLAEGKAPEAAVKFRAAWRIWKSLDLPFEGARTRLQLGRAYREGGNEEDAGMEIRAALTAFRKLGAMPSVREAEGLSQAR